MAPLPYGKGSRILLLGILISPWALSAASTSSRDVFGPDPHLLNPANAAAVSGHEPGFQKSATEQGVKLDDVLNPQNLPLSSGAAPVDMVGVPVFNDFDDTIHPDPRPRMRKWMFSVLVIGGLIRYLTSPSYRRFVSEVLDPLAWD